MFLQKLECLGVFVHTTWGSPRARSETLVDGMFP